jgi:uncharacterized protein
MELSHLRRIKSDSELRAVIGEPNPLVCSKIHDRLNDLTRKFVEMAPLVMLATAARDGTCDVSPRGDGPGFVRILDEQTLLMPDRPGNRLADALRNIIDAGRCGLLFVIPGVTDTLRVNGRAWITDDTELLAPSTIEGKAPRLGIVVETDEVFTQCSKAFIRGQVWDATRFRSRDELPTNGEIMKSLNPDLDPTSYDAERAARYARREGFY